MKLMDIGVEEESGLIKQVVISLNIKTKVLKRYFGSSRDRRPYYETHIGKWHQKTFSEKHPVIMS
jgi:hypothetical protein